MIKCAADIAKAYDDGGYHLQPFYKVWPSTFNTANAWYDATFAGNLPRASYYAGDDLVFTPYPTLNHLSLFHFGDVAPKQKILRNILVHGSSANLAPSRYILCDYLGYYAGISWELDSVQTMNNSFTLPRYTDGKGVRAFIVQLFGNNANARYTINYTNCNNQDIESAIHFGNTLGTGGLQNAKIAANYNPFIDIGSACMGMKRVNSITVTTLGAGVAVLVLVKPIAEITFRDSSLFVPVEIDYLTDRSKTPIIYDGAKLNFIMTSTGNPASTLTCGYLDFIWT